MTRTHGVFRRQHITDATKEAVLRREDCEPHKAIYVYCDYCMDEGELLWYKQPWEKVGTIRLPAGFVWEHIHPVAHGGTSEPDNITIACAKCNAAKGSKLDWIGPIEQWHIDNPPENFA